MGSPCRARACSALGAGLSRKHVIEGVAASLKRLKLDYVDIVFAHRPDKHTPMEETVRAFNYLIETGATLYWGTSEWYTTPPPPSPPPLRPQGTHLPLSFPVNLLCSVCVASRSQVRLNALCLRYARQRNCLRVWRVACGVCTRHPGPRKILRGHGRSQIGLDSSGRRQSSQVTRC